MNYEAGIELKKEIGTRWKYQPYKEYKHAGQMCEVIKNEDCGEYDYEIKFADGTWDLVFDGELG